MKKIINLKTKIIFIIAFLLLLFFGVWYFKTDFQMEETKRTIFRDDQGRMVVSATLFPIYDFAKEVGGDKVNVILVLPSGVDVHSFIPGDKEFQKIASSSIVFYASASAEPWVVKIVKKTFTSMVFLAVAEGLNDDQDDPHVWLDFTKDKLIIDRIKAIYQVMDPANSEYYQERAVAYQEKLVTLDNQYQQSLKTCRYRDLVQGGHQAFAYLARRYNFNYFPSQGIEPNFQINLEILATQVKQLKASGQGYVYYEELIMPSLAEAIRQQTGAKMLMLNSAHNVARYDIESGLNFIKIMENDLKILKIGQSCD